MSENKKAVPGRDGKRATTASTLNIAQNNITMFHFQCQQQFPILNSKIPPPVTEGVFFYHTLSETPIASYKRCFCFVVALGTALSMASFFLRLAE